MDVVDLKVADSSVLRERCDHSRQAIEGCDMNELHRIRGHFFIGRSAVLPLRCNVRIVQLLSFADCRLQGRRGTLRAVSTSAQLDATAASDTAARRSCALWPSWPPSSMARGYSNAQGLSSIRYLYWHLYADVDCNCLLGHAKFHGQSLLGLLHC